MDTVLNYLQLNSFTTLGLAGIICLLFIAYRSALPKPIAGIPYDERAAKNLFGSLPEMISYIKSNGVVIPWLTSHNAQHHAPLVQFFTLPYSRPTLVLSDYQESQDILLRRTKEFDRADKSVESFQGLIPNHHIAMKSADPRFKGNKELVRDLMSPNFLTDVSAAQIYSKSLALIELWSFKTKAASGKPFEARQDMFDSAMDMINAAAFGFGEELSIIQRQLDHFVSGDNAIFQEAPNGSVNFPRLPFVPDIAALITVVDFLGSQIVSPLPTATYYYRTLTDRKLRGAMRMKDEVIKLQIKNSFKRLQTGDDTQHSATDFLIHREYSVARKEKREPEFFSKRNIDELFGYIVAGHETTSSTLSWALKLIADNQHVQRKLQQTLITIFPDAISEARLPNANEIARTSNPYLDAVIEEVLRVGQPTPMVAREAIVDTILLGHMVPKGTTILINSAGPGYHGTPIQVPDTIRSDTSRTKYIGASWESTDIDDFSPDRWLKKDSTGNTVFDSQSGPFLSFGLGPRGCFGRRLAYLEMRIVLTLLLWNFKFSKLEGDLASYKTLEAVTVMPKFCYVQLEPVNQ